jgi:hypothetical protein
MMDQPEFSFHRFLVLHSILNYTDLFDPSRLLD